MVLINTQWSAAEKAHIDPKSLHRKIAPPIPLPKTLLRDLRLHRAANPFSQDHHPIFATRNGTPLNQSNFDNRIFKPAARRAGVPWATPHTLRQTCGTRLDRSGFSATQIASWLGHHSGAFSLEHYVGKATSFPDVDAAGFDRLAGAQ